MAAPALDRRLFAIVGNSIGVGTSAGMTTPPVVRWRKAQGTAPGARPPLLVMLHGRGADENDLFELAPIIDPAFAIASIRGPLDTDEGGFTWSESRSVGRADPKSLRAAIRWFRGWLDSATGGRPEPQRVYLLGFSAGMAMAGALLLDDPARYAGAVLLSGTLPFDTDVPVPNGRLRGMDIFHAHGSFDTVIPADLVERTDRYLREQSGANLTLHRYPIAHDISLPEVNDIAAWLVEHL